LSLPHAVPQQLTARLGSEPEHTQHHLVVFFGAEIHILEELLGLLVDLLLLVIFSKTFLSSLTLRKNKLECFFTFASVLSCPAAIAQWYRNRLSILSLRDHIQPHGETSEKVFKGRDKFINNFGVNKLNLCR